MVTKPWPELTLDVAIENFRCNPTNFTAGQYIAVACSKFAPGELDEDEYLDLIAEVTHWLLNGTLLMLPDNPR